MIWGIQWDETLKWLIDTGEKTYREVSSNSTSWGNYQDNSFTYYTNTSKSTATKSSGSITIIPSGAYEGANANNVYDLAGNLRDMTLESNGGGATTYRYVRGGIYNADGSNLPSSNRYNGISPSDSGDGIGFRCTLFIK